jgi:hypothetical protein
VTPRRWRSSPAVGCAPSWRRWRRRCAGSSPTTTP